MNARLTPAALSGTLRAPTSKSDAHRALIAAALCDSPTEIILEDMSADIQATMDCLCHLGAELNGTGPLYRMRPLSPRQLPSSPLLDCAESGTTLRLLLPVAAALGSMARFCGSGRLPQRPIGELVAALNDNGCTFSQPQLPFSIGGALRPGSYALPGNISSQYLSGLLLGLPLLPGDSRIVLTTALESAAYVDMTLHTLSAFGVQAELDGQGYRVPGCQKYRSPGRLRVEGDWSNAAFFLAAGALAGPITVKGLAADSLQGDRRICGLLRRFGAEVAERDDAATVTRRPLHGIDIDVSEVPDLFPVLAVVAAGAQGTTRLLNAARLRMKESDRLHAVASMLIALGASALEQPDALVIEGTGILKGGMVKGCNDHRIVMAAAIASLICREPVTVSDGEAIRKSYPRFFEDFNSLGGMADVAFIG